MEILRDVKHHVHGGVDTIPLLDISSDDVFLPAASTSDKLHRDFSADNDDELLFHSFQQRQQEFVNEIRKSAEECKTNTSKTIESFDASLELSQVENVAILTTVSPALPTSPTSTISPIEISPRLISPYSDSPVEAGFTSLSDFKTPDIGRVFWRYPVFYVSSTLTPLSFIKIEIKEWIFEVRLG